MTVTRVYALATVLVMTALSGCATNRQLKVASAGATGCAPAAIDVSEVRTGVSTRAWIARCSGISFQCSMLGDAATTCTPVRGGTRDVSDAAVARQEALLRRQGPRFEFSRVGDTLRGVRATFRTEHATFAFTYAPAQGRSTVQVSVAPNPGVALAECTQITLVDAGGDTLMGAELRDQRAQLSRASLVRHTQAQPPPVVRYCGREWALRRADVYGFERLDGYMQEALLAHAETATGDGSASQTTTDAQPTATSVDTAADASATDDPAARAVRTHLDERAALLRGCAGVASNAVLPLTATWDTAGTIVVHVNGRDDAAIHACATSVLRERRAPAGAAGRLIHVLAPN